MSGLSEDTPNCLIINLTNLELGSVRGAKYVAAQQLINTSDIKYDIIIVVTDNNSELPNLALHSGIRLLVLPTALEQTVLNQQTDCYDGVIQCEPMLTTALLQDLIEPVTKHALIGFCYEDLRSFFNVNKTKVNYQRVQIAEDTCPSIIIPTELNKPNTKLDALMILTYVPNTQMDLIADIYDKANEEAVFITYKLAARGDYEHQEPQALGMLFIAHL